ncbi:MAG: DUF2849 domain-containing protein [Pseudomonadota bacterium]
MTAKKPFTPKVLTANDLLEGDVIYATAEGTWTRTLTKAALLTDPAEAEARLDATAHLAHLLVGAYLADARQGALGPEPLHFREAFRAAGPSNYDHGKAADARRATPDRRAA